MSFRLQEGIQGLCILATVSHPGHVNIFIIHGQHRQIFLAGSFTSGGKLGDGPPRRGFGRLSTGVGVDFGIQHQQVDILTSGQNMIQASIADIVGPAITTDNPHAFTTQVLA